MGKDYYKILGVSKTASDKEIKKAYKKLAVKHHPDKNPDDRKGSEARFKDIAEAYEVLIDKNKRQVFDEYGEEGLKGQAPPGHEGGGGGSGMPRGFSFNFGGNGSGGGGGSGSGGGFRPTNPEDIFAQFFGSRGMGGGMGGMGGMSGMGGMGGMMQGMFGNGMGTDDDMGMGQSQSQGQRKGKGEPLNVKLNLSLEDLYTGCTKKMKITRTRMEEGKAVKVPKVVEINVKPGWKHGTKITFEKEGDEAPGVVPGDVVFTVEEAKHPRFERRGNDLVHRRSLSLTQALTGIKFEVVGIDGQTVTVDCQSDLITPHFRKVIESKGMPKSKTPNEKGALVIEFDIQWPTRPLNPQQKKKILEADLFGER